MEVPMGTTAQFRFVEMLPDNTSRTVATVHVPRDGGIAVDILAHFVRGNTVGCYGGHGDHRGMGRYAIGVINAMVSDGLEPELVAYSPTVDENHMVVIFAPRIWEGPAVYPAFNRDNHVI
jgi:hypothetical protein